jgi:hypothetical protein
MLTERAHEMFKQSTKCACLVFNLQNEIDGFEDRKECKHKLKRWVRDLLNEVNTEIDHICSKGLGLNADAQYQYVEITNKLWHDMPTNHMLNTGVINYSTRLIIVCKQLEIEAERLNNLADKKCYRVHPKLIRLLKKVIESVEINISSRRIAELVTMHLKSADATLTYFLGTYKEQLDAIKEYQDDTTRILQ